MSRPRLLLVAVVVSLAVVLAGCASPEPEAVNIARLRVPVAGALKPYYEQTLRWKPCANGMTCATVRVPLDWTHVSSKFIAIALVKHSATGKRVGSLVVNPGGPGGSGVDFVQDDLTAAVDPAIARSYDVIGFDPRGVGRSDGVECLSNTQLDSYLFSVSSAPIGSRQWIAAQQAKSQNIFSACQKRSGDVLDHIDTISAAQDLDVIRAALHESHLNYLGYSYGSYLGTVYAGLHPARVGRTVFDGAEDPWLAEDDGDDPNIRTPAKSRYDFGGDVAVIQFTGFESDLKSYFRSCLAESTKAIGRLRCPFAGTVSDASAQTAGILAAATKRPLNAGDGLRLDGCPSRSRSCPRSIARSDGRRSRRCSRNSRGAIRKPRSFSRTSTIAGCPTAPTPATTSKRILRSAASRTARTRTWISISRRRRR